MKSNNLRKAKAIGTLLLTTVLMTVLAAACSPTPAGEPKTGTETPQNAPKILNVGITNPPQTFAAYTSYESAQWGLSGLLFDTLYKLNEETWDYDPFIAETVTTEDNQTYAVRIRDNAVWSDGTPISSDDAVFSVNFYAKPIVNSSLSQYFGLVEGLSQVGRLADNTSEVSGVAKIDDKSFSVTMKFPVSRAYFLANVGTGLRVLPKHIFEDFNLENLASNEFNLNPSVTSGPYKLKRFQVDQYVQFVPNEDYYLGAPKLDELNFKFLTAANIAVQLQSGEVDMNVNGIGNLSIDDFDTLNKIPGVTLHEKVAVQRQLLEINTVTFPSPPVRKAINLAINRELIVSQLLKGKGAPAYNPLSPKSIYNNADVVPEYNPQKAKEYLVDAGFDFTKEYIFVVPTGNQKREQAGEVIAQNLTDLGLKIKIEKYDFATASAKVKQGGFDLWIVSTGPSDDNPNPGFRSLFGTGGGGNTMKFSDSVIDDLLDEALRERDDAKQVQIYKDIQARLYELGSPAAAIYAESQLQAINNRVRNVRVANSSGAILANAYEWTVADK